MSVKELLFKFEGEERFLNILVKNGELVFREGLIETLILDKNEAHLLMLYLQEHLLHQK